MTELATPPRDIAQDVAVWVHEHVSAEATVADLARLPGHSGLTYKFTITDRGTRQGVVLRIPPAGVRHHANLDVVRLAPVLDLVAQAGVAVPPVLSASHDPRWFGVPHLMVGLVAGAPLPDVFDAPADAFPDRATTASLFSQALEQLALLHSVDPTPLAEFESAKPVTPTDDLAQWLPLLHKSDEPDLVRRTRQLGTALARSVPPDDRVAIVHGDFYSNNWLFDKGEFTSLLDWENTTVARPMWDLGWLATIYDPTCWGPSRAPEMTWSPSIGDLYTWYERSGTQSVRHPAWYQALMCYRLACITPAKVRLHRSGRRVDPIWEIFAEAIPYQIDRAFDLLKEHK